MTFSKQNEKPNTAHVVPRVIVIFVQNIKNNPSQKRMPWFEPSIGLIFQYLFSNPAVNDAHKNARSY